MSGLHNPGSQITVRSLIACGRCALQTLKERKDAPSNFTLKLRKPIRTRRLEDVRSAWCGILNNKP
jgi:predicted ribosome quality control (RQC) complex YloA/Tae2 family protein